MYANPIPPGEAIKLLDRIEQKITTRKGTAPLMLNKQERRVLHLYSEGYVHGSSRTMYSRLRVLELVQQSRAYIIGEVTHKLAGDTEVFTIDGVRIVGGGSVSLR